MDCHGVFSTIVERKEDNYVFWELIYELWNQLRIFYKENTKFSELISFYYVQWLFCEEKLHLLDSLMKYKKWGEYWFENNENWTM